MNTNDYNYGQTVSAPKKFWNTIRLTLGGRSSF